MEKKTVTCPACGGLATLAMVVRVKGRRLMGRVCSRSSVGRRLELGVRETADSLQRVEMEERDNLQELVSLDRLHGDELTHYLGLKNDTPWAKVAEAVAGRKQKLLKRDEEIDQEKAILTFQLEESGARLFKIENCGAIHALHSSRVIIPPLFQRA